MTALDEFLLARIAEDEAVAGAAATGPWAYGDIESVAGGSLYDPDVMIASIHWDNVGTNPEPVHRFRSEQQADATGRHIARWNPTRVLAECEAKRRVVTEHQRLQAVVDQDDLDPRATALWDGLAYALHAIAAVYAQHPDFRQEWL